jgi:hypothetical protein
MVQASNQPRGKTNGTIRGPLRVESIIPQNKQQQKGWYWCHEKKALFRYSDWHKSWDEIPLVSS